MFDLHSLLALILSILMVIPINVCETDVFDYIYRMNWLAMVSKLYG
jgi:hypothetical protein